MHSTLYLFSTALAAGLPLFLPLIPLASFGRRIFVLMSLISVLSVGVAMLDQKLLVDGFHLGLAAFLIAFNVALPRQPGVDPSIQHDAAGEVAAPSRAPIIVAWTSWLGAVVCGVTGLVREGLLASSELGLPAVWTISQRLSSAALLGASAGAMVLGHWYLISSKLSFAPLRRLTALVGILVGVRAVVVFGGVSGQWGLWRATMGTDWTRFVLGDGLFLVPRTLFGLVLPAVLAFLAWRCVRIRSNQSATGILYVLVAFVLIGEILAYHFLLSDQRFLL